MIISGSSDSEWLDGRIDSLNELAHTFFIEKVGMCCNDGMSENEARSAALVLLIDEIQK